MGGGEFGGGEVARVGRDSECRYLEGVELDELAHGAVHRHRGRGLEQVGADLGGAYRIVERLGGGGGGGVGG